MNHERTCIGCMQRVMIDAAADLVRLVVTADGIVAVDLDRGLHGRGLYVHVRPDCLTRAVHRGLARASRGAARWLHTDTGSVRLTIEGFARAIRLAFEHRIQDVLHTAFRTRCAMPSQDQTDDVKLVMIAHDASRLGADNLQREISQGRALLWGNQQLFAKLCGLPSECAPPMIAITSGKLADAIKTAAVSIDACAFVERSAVAVTRAVGDKRGKSGAKGNRAVAQDEKENVDQLGTDDDGGSGKLERVA